MDPLWNLLITRLTEMAGSTQPGSTSAKFDRGQFTPKFRGRNRWNEVCASRFCPYVVIATE